MKIPLIGVTTFYTVHSTGLKMVSVTEAYVRALIEAGACPVLIPLNLPPAHLAALWPRLDGILFTGGGDIDPVLYGAGMRPEVGGVDAERDAIELDLVRRAAQEQRPFLGICRGFQVANVGLGGTLFTDISAEMPGALQHDHTQGKPRQFHAHPVDIAPGSRLAEILGATRAEVNSLHHQGAAALAPGLRVSACAPDGLAEALELPEHPFGIAVQWHPEWLLDDEAMRRLFRAFVTAAATASVSSLSSPSSVISSPPSSSAPTSVDA